MKGTPRTHMDGHLNDHVIVYREKAACGHLTHERKIVTENMHPSTQLLTVVVFMYCCDQRALRESTRSDRSYFLPKLNTLFGISVFMSDFGLKIHTDRIVRW